MKRCRIVIIAKAPIPGFCKTRLIPELGAGGAAALASRMLVHTAHQAIEASVGPVELCAAPNARDPVWATLALPTALEWSDQGSGDLGQRMANAARRTLARGEHLLLIGSDCPSLDAQTLKAAANALHDHSAALIAAFDGGYVALGLTQFGEDLFTDMPWSTSSVAAITQARIERQGWTLASFGPLHDIDEPQDLQHLPDALQVAQ